VAGVGIVGGTAVRTHVWLSLGAVNADTSPSFISGLIVFDKSDTSANRPNVLSDFYTDWMHLRQISPGTAMNSIAFPTNAPTNALYGADYDIRAKRKIHEMNDSLFFCLANQGSAAENYSFFIRTLVMLP
jgi:hypothetical protein